MTRSAVYRSVCERFFFFFFKSPGSSIAEVMWCDPFAPSCSFVWPWKYVSKVEEGGEGESSAGVACRPSVGLWCKRACERLPCDTPTALRQELRHRQLTVAPELNAATHAVIGLVFETRPSSRRTTSFFVAFSGEEPVGFMQLLAPKLFRNKTPTLVSYSYYVYSLVC